MAKKKKETLPGFRYSLALTIVQICRNSTILNQLILAFTNACVMSNTRMENNNYTTMVE